MGTAKQSLLLRRLSFYTLVALYLLILVGGMVRALGAGMGCPDWPKCFGQLVPPTEASDLPEGYEQEYVEGRLQKNARLADMLESLGWTELAHDIRTDPAAREAHPFHPFKTWVEYVNRLLGAVVGLLVLLTLVATLRPFRALSFALVLVALVITVFQAWIGSLVVSTNLLPWMVTVHMLLALVIVGLFSVVVLRHGAFQPGQLPGRTRAGLLWSAAGVLVLTFVQVGLGTQVRETVDQLLDEGLTKAAAASELGLTFSVHKTMSWLVAAGVLGLVLGLQRHRKSAPSGWSAALWSLAVVGGSMVLGLVLAEAALPAFAQPLHLLLGSLLFGTLWFLLLFLFRARPID